MVHSRVHHAVPALLQIRPQLNIRLAGGAPIYGSPLFSCGQWSNMPPKSPEKSPDFTPKNTNGNKACACYIYKSAAELTERLTPPRHPRAIARGRRNKHTPSQPKRSVSGKQVRGGQGAPLTRLRCPVVPAARKLVFMPPLLLSVFGVPVPFHKRVVSVNFLNTYLPITSPTLKHPNTQHIQTLCSWQPSFVQ